jgi:biopolymer transport protein ExbD
VARWLWESLGIENNIKIKLQFNIHQRGIISMKNIFLVLSIFMLSVGCSAKYTTVQVNENSTIPKIERSKSVLISVPKDGHYAANQYVGSGKMTAMSVKSAFARYTNDIKISESCSEKPDCIAEAKNNQYYYLAYPEILQWEDRATEWSGLPDRIEIKITIFDTALNSEVDSVIIRGKSKWMTMGGDHPQDLLQSPISQYISKIYE